MTCRAPSSATTCSGTPNGQALTWDVEGHLSTWQNTTTNPTVTAKYLYDGEGNRVVQRVVDSTAGSTTTTSYVGSLETYSITTGGGPTGITTTDYLAAGKVLAESVNGTLSYLATSYQGSVVEALDSTGTVGVTASQLYVPYGGIRYANGSLPTDYGYTGQRRDASTGLDYYGARYYDPTVGQFTSADTEVDGSNRYGYVGGNPTTATDPSGHQVILTGELGARTSEEGFAWGTVAVAGVLTLGLIGYGVAHHHSPSSRDGDAANAAVAADVAANTYAVAGASVYVTATGAVVVTTGATTTGYAVGSAGWEYWNEQVSGAYAADTAGAWNTGRASNWVATHPTTTKTDGGGGGGQPGNAPADPGRLLLFP